MSLRAFHLLFIAISIVLAAFVAAWAMGQYRAVHEVGYLGAVAASLTAAGALAMYAAAFRRKTRGM
jgi:hypothetical protein